ncbi:hypothetical protein HZB02_00705 [Candidatus Woesearchaeota archaeon]|nr:hypothetical protein [Candidatus Woesearchaeota archaeon]
MCLDIRRVFTQESFFLLAQLLAILSGTWMVASAMFSDQMHDTTFLSQDISSSQTENFRLMIDVYDRNLTSLVDPLVNLSVINSKQLKLNQEYYGIVSSQYLKLFLWGVGFAFVSILMWVIGAMLPTNNSRS